jgi:hypothetical protein
MSLAARISHEWSLTTVPSLDMVFYIGWRSLINFIHNATVGAVFHRLAIDTQNGRKSP